MRGRSVERLDDAARAGSLRADVAVSVGRTPVGRQIRAGFVGLSVEYPAVTMYAGSDRRRSTPCSRSWFATSLRSNARRHETYFLSSHGDHPIAAGHSPLAKAVGALLLRKGVDGALGCRSDLFPPLLHSPALEAPRPEPEFSGNA